MNNFPNLSFMTVFMVINKIITPEEADKLTNTLSSERVPSNWRKIKDRMEEVLERKLDE